MEYKGYYIEDLFGMITVQYMSDDVVFDTVEEAQEFIDEIIK